MKGSLIRSALGLAALLSVGINNRFAAHAFDRKLAPAVKTRTWTQTKGGKVKTVFPGQTPAQKKAALAQAEEKRARRSLTAGRNARNSAEGYARTAGRTF